MNKLQCIFILVLLAGMSASLKAQEPLPRMDKHPVLIDDIRKIDFELDRPGCLVVGIPVSNLSKEQVVQLQALQTKKQKKLNELNNQLAEKQAKQRTLESADKPPIKAIYKVIDEQIALLGKIMKLKAEYKQDVRSVLTDEQRVEFDARPQYHQQRHWKNRRK